MNAEMFSPAKVELRFKTFKIKKILIECKSIQEQPSQKYKDKVEQNFIT